MRFAVLGELAVESDRPVPLRGPQLRRLLAVLLLHADQVVSLDRLAEIVFGGTPSGSADTTLRSYVARVRRLLVDDGSGAAIVTVSSGYRLELGTSTLDAQVFERAIERARRAGRDHQPAAVVREISEVMPLWRGPAYADFADEDWVHAEALRLEELRVEAVELRLRALVDSGAHDQAIPELTALVDTHPLRAEVWASLALALYRAGRQAEALRVAARHRSVMADHGLDPAPDLVTLEGRISLHDPALRHPAPSLRRMRGYRVVEELGRGRHGAIHRAVQPGVDREVAIRICGPEVADQLEVIREFDVRLHRVAGLQHPYVVPILDYWREPAVACLVTRLLTGGDLAASIDKGPADAEFVGLMVEQVASALHAAHRVSLAHGVLTPHDVLFDDDGNAYVDGIGVAEALDVLLDVHPDDPYETGSEAGDAASRDQLMLAALAYHALTGFPPFRGVWLGGFPPLSDTRPELLALDGVLARAAAPLPDDRYPDIATFARAFAVALGRIHHTVPAVHVPVPNPYRGLRAFGENDADVFFGRGALVDRLVGALAGPHGSFVTVVGASGSGKSSVVRAGLLPRLRAGAVDGSDRWLIATMVPGSDPFAALATALSDVAATPLPTDPWQDAIDATVRRVLPPGSTLLLVIDQLEELYVQVDDDRLRTAFIRQLADAMSTSRVRVIATLRADLYDRPLGHHLLGRLVVDGAVPVVGMSPAELGKAIVEPAATIAMSVEESVVADIVAACVDQPGSLPLLQFTMTELFNRRAGNVLTYEEYEQMGGISGAIADRAEHIHQASTPTQQELARQLFLRLVEVRDGDDLRRRVERSEVRGLAGEDGAMDEVVERFVAARLLTSDRDPATRAETIEVAHEALLRAWPRLRGWIRDEGRDLEIRAEVSATATTWDRGGRDAGDLLRGPRLGAAEDLAQRRASELTDLERAFVGAAVAERDDELLRERARADRQRKMSRRLWIALGAAACVLVVAVVVGLVAVDQRDRARDETRAAQRARADTLAAVAESELNDDRSRALLLAVEANRLADTPSTRRSLLAALGGGAAFSRTTIPTPAGDYSAIVATPAGDVAVAKRGDGSLDVIDLVTRTVRHAGIASPPRIDQGLTLHPDGTLVASAGVADDGVAAVVVDIGTGERVAVIDGVPGGFHEARFAPDGRRLVVGGPDGRIGIFATDGWSRTGTIDLGEQRTITTMDFVDGDRLLVAATPLDGLQPTANATLTVFELDSGEAVLGPVDTDSGLVTDLEIAQEVGIVVTAADDAVQLRRLEDLEPFGERFGESEFGGYTSVALSPDGVLVAVSAVDFDVFGLGGERPEPIRAAAAPRYSGVAFTADGGLLVAAGADGDIATVEVGWVDDLGNPLEPTGPGLVLLSPDGRTLAVWARMRGVQFFDAATMEHLGGLPIGPDRSFVGFAFAPDGDRVVTLTCDFGIDPSCPASLSVWDVGSADRIAGPIDAGDVWAGMFDGAVFVDDGERVATAGFGGDVRLWDAETLEAGGDPLLLADVAPFPGDEVRQLATTVADGRSILIATGELNEAVVWDVSDGGSEPVGHLAGNISNVGTTPDGMLITAQGSGTFQFHDAQSLEPLGEPFATGLSTQHFHAAANGTLVTSSFQGTLLWDVETRRAISGPIASLYAQLSPDGATLFLGGLGDPYHPGGMQVSAMSLDRDSLVADACARAGRNLTDDEWSRFLPDDDPERTCPEWPLPMT